MTLVLDAGALIGVERGDPRALSLFTDRPREFRLVVPAPVLAQVWRGGPQPLLSRLLRSGITVQALDEPSARAIGRLLRHTGTSDVVDAHVVLVARQHDAAVVSSDPDDLRALDPRIRVHAL